MIFLRDNVLVERDLTFDDVKPRLLGMFDIVNLVFDCLANINQGIGERALVSCWCIPISTTSSKSTIWT